MFDDGRQEASETLAIAEDGMNLRGCGIGHSRLQVLRCGLLLFDPGQPLPRPEGSLEGGGCPSKRPGRSPYFDANSSTSLIYKTAEDKHLGKVVTTPSSSC